MFDPALRDAKDRVLYPLARRIGRRVHPTTLTVVGFGIGLASALALIQGERLLALALWWLNRFLDGLDGTVARAQGTQSDWGGYLDLLCDFALYALLPLSAALGTRHDPSHSATDDATRFLWLAVMMGSFYVNAASWMFLSAVLEKRNASARIRGGVTSVAMPSGLIEGTETIVLFSLFIVAPGALVALFVLTTVLVLATAIQRVVWAGLHLRER